MTRPERDPSSWTPRVLLVEDDQSMRAVLRYNLEEEGLEVIEAARGDQAVRLLDEARTRKPSAGPAYDLVLADLKMPGADGMTVLRAARKVDPDLPVVLVTAFGTVDHAVEAMNLGAADYITKPFRRAELKARIRRVLDQIRIQRENRLLRARIERPNDGGVVSTSPRMEEVLRIVDRVALSDATVLLQGESGTGKELIARRLHDRSPRSGRAFVPVNCAALPADLLESELFGHQRGAFTGADRSRAGRFQRADGGTLFLDEIGELPLGLQAKLLRALEEGVVEPLGSTRPVQVDVRVVAATNRDLAGEAAAGRFRPDLFHRLSVIPISLPPLRERREDIPVLVRHFLGDLGVADEVTVAPALLGELQQNDWPGNVRELKNMIERMVLLRRTDTLDLVDLALPGSVVPGGTGEHQASPDPLVSPSTAPGEEDLATLRPGEIDLPEAPFSLPDLEREIVLKALSRHLGNRSAAARYLGIPRHVLLYRLGKYEQAEAEASGEGQSEGEGEGEGEGEEQS